MCKRCLKQYAAQMIDAFRHNETTIRIMQGNLKEEKTLGKNDG